MERIEHIRGQAETVAAQHARMQEAFAEERAAEAAVLEAAIAAARPALPALVSRLIARDETRGVGTERARHEREYHAERGVVLAGDARPRRDVPRADRGRYEGEALVLLADGRLAQLRWAGQWSRWQGSTDTATSTLHPYGSIADAIADGWSAESAIARLAEALEQQATGAAERRVQNARARAERLRAVVTMLR